MAGYLPLRQVGSPSAVPYADVLATEADAPAVVLRKYTHLTFSLGLFLLADVWLKAQVAAAGVQFPSALIGMFVLFFSLVTLDKAAPKVLPCVPCETSVLGEV